MKLFHKSQISEASTFREVYEQNSPAVFRYVYSLIGGLQHEAEDLTAETFLRAWNARYRFEGDIDSAIAWLISIAKRLVIDEYRRQKVRVQQLPELKPELAPEQQLMATEQKQHIFRLLAGLPEAQREIVILRYMLGWQVNRIARHLGETENSVSVTLYRTLQKLRHQLAETDLDEVSAVAGRGRNDHELHT